MSDAIPYPYPLSLRFRVWYTVDTLVVEGAKEDLLLLDPDDPSSSWPYSTGFVTESLIDQHLPKPDPHVALLLCGPPPMIKMAVKPALERLGHSPHNCFTF